MPFADPQALGKPLLMEEFGVWGGDSSEQQLYYRLVYDTIAEVSRGGGLGMPYGGCTMPDDDTCACASLMQNARAGGPCAGSLFWVWYAEGQKAPAEEGGLASGLFGTWAQERERWAVPLPAHLMELLLLAFLVAA